MAETTQFTSGARSGGTSGSAGSGDSGALDAERMVENAKNMGNQLIGAVRDSATSMMDDQRNRAADQIASVAGMVRNSVQSLDRQSAGAICQYADDAASTIDSFAETLRTRSWGELAGDVEGFARRWPMAFMTAAIGAGFLAGRFLVASGTRVSRVPRPSTTGTSTMTSTGTMTRTGMSEKPTGGARYDYGSTGTGGSTGAGGSTGTAGTTTRIGGTGSRESF